MRKCSYKILQKHKNLCYSKQADGVFCLPCKLFYSAPVSGTEGELLITAPYRDWKRLNERVTKHNGTAYHIRSAVSGTEYTCVRLDCPVVHQSSCY